MGNINRYISKPLQFMSEYIRFVQYNILLLEDVFCRYL